MRSILALAAVLVVAVSATRNFEKDLHDYTFEQYLVDFGKSYPDATDYQLHQATFQAKVQEVLAHNAAGHSWRMAVNKFSDMTEAELVAFTGFNKEMAASRRAMMRDATPADVPSVPLSSLPSSIDWREKGVVTPVKDQGGCGSCWAFAATESIESALLQATGKQAILSPQDLVSCTPNPQHCGGTGGCSGATAELAFDYVKEKGIASDADYPYTQQTGTCKPSVKKTAHIDGYVKLGENNYTDLVTAVATKGPIAVSVDASPWFSYSSGVFTGCPKTKVDINHAVQLVGYGTDGGRDYWIIRNSWGGGWGEKGYIRMEKHSDGDMSKWCYLDDTPSDGSGCEGGPPTITVCGSCGIWYDTCYPTGAAYNGDL